MGKLTESDAQRFWAKVDFDGPIVEHVGTPCWDWTAATRSTGYGLFGVKHRTRSGMAAHRVAYELAEGEDPGPWHVLHLCDRRCCVRRDHLYLGTNADNVRDRVDRGRTKTWATERERLGESHPRAKLTDDIVRESRLLWKSGSETSVSLAARHGVAQATMHAALTGQTWGHL